MRNDRIESIITRFGILRKKSDILIKTQFVQTADIIYYTHINFLYL